MPEAPKKRGGRTAGTFPKGNGPGYGGAAKGGRGKGEPPKAAGPGRPDGVKTGQGKKGKTREALEAAAPMAIETVIAIAKDQKDLRSLTAAFGILNRVGLHEKSGVEHTGEGGEPIQVNIRIVEP